MTDHLLHLGGIESEGYVEWRLECTHEPGGRWACTNSDGEPITPPPDATLCWLSTWWDEFGGEMLGDIEGPVRFPLPVRPSDDWSYYDGGTIVREADDE